MKFSVNRGVIQMLELIDRSPRLRSMLWTVIGVAGASWLLRAMADLMTAVACWRS